MHSAAYSLVTFNIHIVATNTKSSLHVAKICDYAPYAKLALWNLPGPGAPWSRWTACRKRGDPCCCTSPICRWLREWREGLGETCLCCQHDLPYCQMSYSELQQEFQISKLTAHFYQNTAHTKSRDLASNWKPNLNCEHKVAVQLWYILKFTLNTTSYSPSTFWHYVDYIFSLWYNQSMGNCWPTLILPECTIK